MKSSEIRQRFLDFFAKRNHAVLDSASLVTSDNVSVTGSTLFNTAGVQPLIPAILAGEHPAGVRLASAQKCVRTTDLEEVGDNTHLTFFEMLGNWSIGDYFKKEAINWSFEFLTSTEEGVGLDINRLYVTVFEGDDNSPRDEESYGIWKEIFESKGLDPEKRIFYMPAENNWWAAGDNGPCGPDTEMFYDVSGKHTEGLTKEEYILADDSQEVVEIWNDVFMEFEKKDGAIIGKLPKQNVDTGSGLERLTMVLQGARSVYETDMFAAAIDKIEELTGLKYGDKTDEEYIDDGEQCWVDTRSEMKIIADHVRSAMFMIADGALPSNTDRGYIVRRILRRAIRLSTKLNLEGGITKILEVFPETYGDAYPNINDAVVLESFRKEEESFLKTLSKGLREFEKGERDSFVLFTTYGFPLEMTIELAEEKGETIDVEDFNKKMQEHQAKSRAGAEQKFKGGLSDHNDETIKLHTAHHLLLAALQEVVSSDIHQKGSNITGERMRMDFSFDRKLTDEEKSDVENLVNEKIQAGLNVIRREMPLAEAMELGAEMEFGTKYPDTVSVYFVEDANGVVFSKEFCGGPHIENTKDLGTFRIKKEKASSAGVRRIKAVLE